MGDIYEGLLSYWGWLKLNALTKLITSTGDAGGFQVNWLHMGVNCLHQLPYASGLFPKGFYVVVGRFGKGI